MAGSDTVGPRLGWATQSKFSFTTTYQCQASTTAQLDCYLRAPNGQVLRVYFSPSGYYCNGFSLDSGLGVVRSRPTTPFSCAVPVFQNLAPQV